MIIVSGIFILVIVDKQMTINILIIDYLLHLFLNMVYLYCFVDIWLMIYVFHFLYIFFKN